ncbi:hypothetical protein N9M52_00445 [bacterium]|nr:hypothetical protein [bacterium]
MAIKANITIDQGADFTANIDVKSSDGQAYNLTGHTVRAQMRKNFTTSSVTAQFIATHNDAGGVITLKLPNSNVVDGDTVTQVGTNSIEAGRYLYDVEIVSTATTVVTRVVQGTVTVSGGITK